MRRLAVLIVLGSLLTGSPAFANPRDSVEVRAASTLETVKDLRDVCRDVPNWRNAAGDEAAYARVLTCLGYVRGAVDLFRSFQRWNGVHVLCIDRLTSVFDLVDGFLTAVDPIDAPDDDPALYLVAAIRARHGCR